jgi:hypothetical protein
MQCWHSYRSLTLVGMVAVAIGATCVTDCWADHPPHPPVPRMPVVRTLTAPCDREGESPLQPMPARPYAYGYFGAKGGPTAQRHFGYYNNYRQWTFR